MRRCEGVRKRSRRWGLVACLLVVTWVSGATAQVERQMPQVLRLSDAIEIALEGSTRLGIQDIQLDASRKASWNAFFDLGPDLSFSYSQSAATRLDFDVVFDQPAEFRHLVTVEGDTLRTTVGTRPLAVGDQEEISSFRQYRLTTNLRVFDGFANIARYSAARHDVQADQHMMDYTRKQVTADVIADYYNVLRAELLLRVAEEAEAVSREQLERTEALYELGSAARSDVLKSQVAHGNTRLDLVRAQNAERQARVDLEHALNLTSATTFQVDTTVTNIRFEPIEYTEERSFALSNREDLRSLRSEEAAAGRRVWAARGPLFPSLDFQYSVRQEKQTSSFRFGSPKNRTRSWSFIANWNIWDRYLTYASVAQARATRRVAEYSRRQAELDAVREIRNLVNDLKEARERLTVSRENVARSREDLRLAQEKFRVGAGTILDTITAESDLTATRAAEVEAVVDYLIGRASLARATGRPFREL